MKRTLEQEVKRICNSYAKGYDSGMAGFMSDLRQSGCSSGMISELIYYLDTVKFHDKFEEEIWNLAFEDAEDQGINIMEFISSLNGSDNVGDLDQLKNLLAWFAFEEIAFRLFDNE